MGGVPRRIERHYLWDYRRAKEAGRCNGDAVQWKGGWGGNLTIRPRMRNDQIYIRLKPGPTACAAIRAVLQRNRERPGFANKGRCAAHLDNRLGGKQNAWLKKPKNGFEGSKMSQNTPLLFRIPKVRHFLIESKRSSSAPKWDDGIPKDCSASAPTHPSGSGVAVACTATSLASVNFTALPRRSNKRLI